MASHPYDNCTAIAPHVGGDIASTPLQIQFELFQLFQQPRLGTFALWFGWYGFNPGSTLGMHDYATGAMAAQVAMNTTLSAATGGITVFVVAYFITKKYDVGALCNGILAGGKGWRKMENGNTLVIARHV